MKEKMKRFLMITSTFMTLVFLLAMPVYAEEVSTKINAAATSIKGILTGLVSIIGVCVSIFIIIKKMPDADNPQEKHELYKGVARVWALVALAAACIWLVPWIYQLFL